MNSYFFQQILLGLYKEIGVFYKSSFFGFLKFLLAIYVIILLVDIILLLVVRGLGANVRTFVSGDNIPSELTSKKAKLKNRWDKIKLRLESGSEAEYKIAIIEADTIIDELLRKMGYVGENMAERLEKVLPNELDDIAQIGEAHKIRNRIIHEDGFRISKDETSEIIGKYEHLLKHFEVL